MRFDPAVGLESLAFGIDPGPQGFRALDASTSLRQNLDPAGIVDMKLGLDGVPGGKAVLAELRGRLRPDRARFRRGNWLCEKMRDRRWPTPHSINTT